MTIKMFHILNFSIFYAAARTQKMPFKTAYKLSQISNAVNTNMLFYQEKLKEIILEYGKLDEEGNPIFTEDKSSIQLRDGADVACASAINELQSLEVDMPDTNLTIDELNCLSLTLAETEAIFPFLQN